MTCRIGTAFVLLVSVMRVLPASPTESDLMTRTKSRHNDANDEAEMSLALDRVNASSIILQVCEVFFCSSRRLRRTRPSDLIRREDFPLPPMIVLAG